MMSVFGSCDGEDDEDCHYLISTSVIFAIKIVRRIMFLLLLGKVLVVLIVKIVLIIMIRMILMMIRVRIMVVIMMFLMLVVDVVLIMTVVMMVILTPSGKRSLAHNII